MPVVTLYKHGMTAGVSPGKNDHVRALRGTCGGWSRGATRRNTRFLYSIEEDQLTGDGFAFTGTVRDCPGDAAAWHAVRRAFEKSMIRAGLIRQHWVTEWQRRGVPHLHCAFWFPAELVAAHGRRAFAEMLVNCWCWTASSCGAKPRGQDCHPITGAVGWFQYVSKHAARGVRHYQRCRESIPAGWRYETGRMWGKVGDWPVRERMRFDLQSERGDRGFFAYRRLVRSWRVASCRPAVSEGDKRRLISARGMLRCSEPALSRVRGVSEWAGLDVSLAFFANLAARGFSITEQTDK